MERVTRVVGPDPKWKNYDGAVRESRDVIAGEEVWVDPNPDDDDGYLLLPSGLVPEVPTAAQRWEEIRITSETGGEKGQKLAQLGSLDPQALLTLAEVSGFGAQKYDRYNFLKGYDWSLSFDAAQRHLLQFWAGEDNDPESGLPHAAHAAWHCLAMLAFLQRELGTDDRFKQEVA